jgi:hypothetical protein
MRSTISEKPSRSQKKKPLLLMELSYSNAMTWIHSKFGNALIAKSLEELHANGWVEWIKILIRKVLKFSRVCGMISR